MPVRLHSMREVTMVLRSALESMIHNGVILSTSISRTSLHQKNLQLDAVLIRRFCESKHGKNQLGEHISGSHEEERKPKLKLAAPKKIKRTQEETGVSLKLRTDGSVDKTLVSAVGKAASSFKGNEKIVQKSLLDKLKEAAALTKERATAKDMLAGKKVKARDERTSLTSEEQTLSRLGGLQRQRRSDNADNRLFKRRPRTVTSDPGKLFDAEPLNLFLHTRGEAPEPDLFSALERREVERLVEEPPRNGLEEMIRWTEQGLMWHFPINNEQGLEEEAKHTFDEHIFLEPQIADFPKTGPIRHFMELVIAGLSSNHWLTVQEKRDHIDWFRQYFKKKRSLLEETLEPKDLDFKETVTEVRTQS